MDFVCLICGTRSEAAGDCRHCDLPFLDARTPEAQEAIEKADAARKHKHDQRLLWISVAGAVFVLLLFNAATLLAIGFIVPAPQQVAVALLIAFGGWRGLVYAFPAHQVAKPAPAGP